MNTTEGRIAAARAVAHSVTEVAAGRALHLILDTLWEINEELRRLRASSHEHDLLVRVIREPREHT